jgi:hypothetical protein
MLLTVNQRMGHGLICHEDTDYEVGIEKRQFGSSGRRGIAGFSRLGVYSQLLIEEDDTRRWIIPAIHSILIAW